jgi:CheY-like chemotaxis protein
VLFVDDDTLDVEQLSRSLRAAGYYTNQVHDIAAARSQVTLNMPALVVIDALIHAIPDLKTGSLGNLHMPTLGLAHWLQANYPHVGCVFRAAVADAPLLEKFKAAGFRLLGKPTDPYKLIGLLQSVRRPQRESKLRA